MLEKLKTALWFANRPTHWHHAVALASRRLRRNRDDPDLRSKARSWAAERSISVPEALTKVGIEGLPIGLDADLMAEANSRAKDAAVRMGGPGDLNLLFDAVRLTSARHVVETGVAYGWSSLAILAALEGRDGASLASVDMPYPKMGNEAYVGIVVPERLRSPWSLVREPDRKGLRKAIALVGGQIDLCHYDSDKTWWGRDYAYPLLWDALRSGGIFISDDIQDNMYFADFVEKKGTPYAVTAYQGKFVGIVRK